ncbi:MAG: hypothetical protein MRJ92_07370 [Nitrospira sp.]|nr:hypothetical protein [Nitrospira sp.]
MLIDAVKADHTEAREYIEEGKGRTLMLKIRQDMGRRSNLTQMALNTKLAKIAQDRDAMLMTILGGGLRPHLHGRGPTPIAHSHHDSAGTPRFRRRHIRQ